MTQITPYQNIFASPSLNPHDQQGLFFILLTLGLLSNIPPHIIDITFPLQYDGLK